MKNKQKEKNDLQKLERAFAIWRSTNKGRRIPSNLWDGAIRLSRVFGIGEVAKITRLNYLRLKKKVVATPNSSPAKRNAGKAPELSFIEVPLNPLPTVGVSNLKESRLIFQFKSLLGTVKVEWI